MIYLNNDLYMDYFVFDAYLLFEYCSLEVY